MPYTSITSSAATTSAVRMFGSMAGDAITSPASLVWGAAPYGFPASVSISPVTTTPPSSRPPLRYIASLSIVSVIGITVSAQEVLQLGVVLDDARLLDERVEAVVAAGGEHDHGDEQQHPHEVAVHEAVAEPGVADPEQRHEDHAAERGQPGEQASDERESDERLEQGHHCTHEVREAREERGYGAERRPAHPLEVHRGVPVAQPAVEELAQTGVEEPPAGDDTQHRHPVGGPGAGHLEVEARGGRRLRVV